MFAFSRSARLGVCSFITGVAATVSCAAPIAGAAPAPPTGLHLQQVASGAVALAWDPVADASNYEFFRNTRRVGSSTRNSPATVDTYLQSAGNVSQYQVRVTTSAGTSALSSPITVTNPSELGITSCPSGINLAANSTIYLKNDVNMVDGSAPCIDLGDNSSLDCKGHSITVTAATQTASVVRFAAGNHALITNCVINTKGSGDGVNAIHVGPDSYTAANSAVADNVTISGNTINGLTNEAYGIDAIWTNHLVIANNTVNQAQIGGFYVPGAVINKNTVTIQNSWRGIAGVIWMHQSSNQFIGDNTVDGGASGLVGRTDANGNLTGGTDDSIIIDGPVNNVWIRDNTLGHNYDAAIEPIDAFRNGHIDSNTISNVYEAGIGEYHRTVFEGNTVNNNKISSSGRAMMFIVGGQLPNDKPIDQSYQSITGNQFNSNTFTSSTRKTSSAACWDGVNHDTTNPVPAQASGNVATGNSFDTTAKAPFKSTGLFSTYSGNTQGTSASSTCL